MLWRSMGVLFLVGAAGQGRQFLIWEIEVQSSEEECLIFVPFVHTSVAVVLSVYFS